MPLKFHNVLFGSLTKSSVSDLNMTCWQRITIFQLLGNTNSSQTSWTLKGRAYTPDVTAKCTSPSTGGGVGWATWTNWIRKVEIFINSIMISKTVESCLQKRAQSSASRLHPRYRIIKFIQHVAIAHGSLILAFRWKITTHKRKLLYISRGCVPVITPLTFSTNTGSFLVHLILEQIPSNFEMIIGDISLNSMLSNVLVTNAQGTLQIVEIVHTTIQIHRSIKMLRICLQN